MTKKKTTVKEFNKDFFNSWTKITKITPHFAEWADYSDDDEDSDRKWQEIEKIDLEFSNGSKLSIIPKSNREDLEEESNENPLCLALDIVQFKPEKIEWREVRE